MLAYGLEKTLVATGSDDNAIVIRKGSQSEMMSLIDRNAANVIRSQPEIATGSDGKPLAAAEAVVLPAPARDAFARSRPPLEVKDRLPSTESVERRGDAVMGWRLRARHDPAAPSEDAH